MCEAAPACWRGNSHGLMSGELLVEYKRGGDSTDLKVDGSIYGATDERDARIEASFYRSIFKYGTSKENVPLCEKIVIEGEGAGFCEAEDYRLDIKCDYQNHQENLMEREEKRRLSIKAKSWGYILNSFELNKPYKEESKVRKLKTLLSEMMSKKNLSLVTKIDVRYVELNVKLTRDFSKCKAEVKTFAPSNPNTKTGIGRGLSCEAALKVALNKVNIDKRPKVWDWLRGTEL